ncbi:MAG: hypothetical protein QUS14_04740 [Pyrinomonadaceae bacterium]|nr:hypothetical protein [Pyrinomonadaceae bacterium]
MVRSELAELLVKTRGKRERRRLLSANASLLDAKLAREIKDVCYRSWTSEPAVARQALTAIDEVAAIVDDRETDALRDWVGGIASITKGELGSAAVLLNAASSKFKKPGQRLESAQPMVAELLALAMLGRYADAERTGRNALKIFEEHGDELAAGKIELNLSNLASRQEKHKLAEKHGLAAVERFTNAGEASWRTMAENSLANTYAELGDLVRAEHFYLKALENAGRAKMTVTEAEIEASLGGLELSRGRFAEALRLSAISSSAIADWCGIASSSYFRRELSNNRSASANRPRESSSPPRLASISASVTVIFARLAFSRAFR